LLQLALLEVAELVHLWRLASHCTLHHIDGAADLSLARNSVLDGLGVDLDQDDSWVLWATVVLSVTKVAQPGLEGLRVVLAHLLAVGLDRGLAGDGRPLARVVEEAQVDFRVCLEVVGLAGLGVGVEDDVDAVALLWDGLAVDLTM